MGLFNRHSKYEMLLTEHLDGRLDEAGQAALDRHLETCDTCAVELRELEAITSLLRSEPLVEAPRSFALPYAPRQAADEPRTVGWLRGMQVATATAAVVLVALVSLQVADVGSLDRQSFSSADTTSGAAAAGGAAAPEMAAAKDDESTTIEPLPPGGTPAPLATPVPGDDGTTMFSVAPPEDGQLTLDTATLPTPDPSTRDSVVPETDVEAGTTGLDVEGAPVLFAAEPEERTAMDWALVAMAIVTAALALGVVGVTWSSRRSRL